MLFGIILELLLVGYVGYLIVALVYWLFRKKSSKGNKETIIKSFLYPTIFVATVVVLFFGSYTISEYSLRKEISKIPAYPNSELVNEGFYVGGADGTFASIEYSIPQNIENNDIAEFYGNFLRKEGWNVYDGYGISNNMFIAKKGKSEIKINVDMEDIRYKADGLSLEESVRLQMEPDKVENLTKIIDIMYRP